MILYPLHLKIGDETVDIHFEVLPDSVEHHVRTASAVSVIGVELYKNFLALINSPNKQLVLGQYE